MSGSEHSDAPRRRPDTPPAETAGEEEPQRPAGEKTRKEIGGPDGPEPTRYGDWERNGRCTDF